jgi:hypothetical protein
MKFSKYIGKIAIAGLILSGVVNTAHAQTAIGSTFKNAVNNVKQNAADNAVTRNQLLADQETMLQIKEKGLSDELNTNILVLENVQTRIAAGAAEAEASGTDMTTVNAWLATSTADIQIAQQNVSAFSSSTMSTSSDSLGQVGIMQARKLAEKAITSVNTAHDDLQSALNALAALI